tara:strand:+ start:616 stop:1008 length:393 start_codon:yes stop_codon:yes gene_type:complete
MKNKMIKNFLIISCIGKNDKLGLRINKDFFMHVFKHKNNNEYLVAEILTFLNSHNIKLDENFSIIVNQGPGSFSGTRVSLAVAKGLEISKKIKLFGYKSTDLEVFNQENIEKLIKKNLIEKKLIKPIYLS